MENNYTLIDEPKIKKWHHLIINPNLILLVCIFVPLFWAPPLYGRFWIPLCWIILNGILLGSRTIKKEIVICIFGGFTMIVLSFLLLMHHKNPFTSFETKDLISYYLVVENACLFFTLYFTIATQNISYQLFQYIHKAK